MDYIQKNNSTLIIANSPFHLIHIYEYINHYDFKNYLIFCHIIKNDDYDSFNKVAKKLDLNGLYFFKLGSKKNSLGNFCNILLLLNHLKKIQIAKYENIVCFQPFSLTTILFYFVSKSKYLTILDEGLASVIWIKNRQNLNSSHLNYRNILFKIIYHKSTFFYFTLLGLNTDKKNQIKKHDFFFLRRKIFESLDKRETVYFIGSPLVEDNLISEKIYFDLLFKIYSSYKNIIYFPHRREDVDRLKLYNLNVLIINIPIELYITSLNFLPTMIIGFQSASLLTLRKLIGNKTEIRFIDVDIVFSKEVIAQFKEAGISQIEI